MTELLEAAEALALLRLKVVPAVRGGASGPVVSDTEVCSECQRSRVLSGMAHAASCLTGRVLAACDVLRKPGGVQTALSEAYARGWGEGQKRAYEQIWDRVKASAEEVAAARKRLDAVIPVSSVCGYQDAVGTAAYEDWQRRSTVPGQAICGRTIAAFGYPGRDVLICDLEPGHGDAWHEDRVAGRKWVPEATEIHFHPETGMVETRFLGREPEFAEAGQ